MGFFTNVIWVIATFILFLGVSVFLVALFENGIGDIDHGVTMALLLVALLLVGLVSERSHKWVKEEGGVSAVLGLGVSKVVEPVSKEVEKFKEGYNR